MRRLLLAVATAVAAVTLGLGVAAPFSASPSLSPAQELAVQLDAALDTLPQDVTVETNPITWAAEILPYFEYEGAVGEAIVPGDIQFTPFLGGREHNHLLGSAQCRDEGGLLSLNARFSNPISSWYGKSHFLPTLVHELAHFQGGGLCEIGPVETVESNTQIVTLEVLAAMANHGNAVALYALLDELRDMAMRTVYYDMLKAGRPGDYFKFHRRIFPEAFDQARAAKAARAWSTDRFTLMEILYRYSKTPIERVMEGLPAGEIPSMNLGPLRNPGFGWGRSSFTRSFKLDDLRYVLNHLSALVAEAQPKLKENT